MGAKELLRIAIEIKCSHLALSVDLFESSRVVDVP